MNKIQVNSSSINTIGYDISTNTLQVEFTRGALYEYEDIDTSEICKLLFSDSIGSYFSKNIAKKYKFKQL